MKDYAADFRAEFSIGREFGDIDMMRVIEGAKASKTPQYWGAKKGGSIFCNLQVRGGMLLFGACDGNFYAVDVESGREAWRYAAGDVVMFFATGDAIYISCYDRCVHAIDFSGNFLWKFRAEGKPGGVAEKGGRVYFGTEAGSFYCIDSSGSQAWKFGTDSHIGAIPKFLGGMVLFGDFHGRLHALDEATGEEKWVFRGGLGMGGCSICDVKILIPTREGKLHALDSAGREVWRINFSDGLLVDMYYEPLKGVAFVSDMGSRLHAIDAEAGKVMWSFKAKEAANIFLAADGKFVYSGDYSGAVHVLALDSGEEAWSVKLNGMCTGGITLCCGKVFIGSWDCNVYCFDKDTGSAIWKFHTSLANMSDWELDHHLDKDEAAAHVTFSGEEIEQIRKEEEELKDYGEFSGSYMAGDRGYMGSAKKGYIRQRAF